MPERSNITLEWGRVSVMQWGDQSSERAVLLLHGGGADSASLSWGGVGPELAAAGYRVIAPDHPGYGESPSASWQATQERLVAYAGEVVKTLGLQRYAVGGLSLGGGISIGHVLTRPSGLVGMMALGSYGIMPRLSDGAFSLASQLMSWALVRSGAMPALMKSYSSSEERMHRGMRSIVRDPAQLTPELVTEIVDATRKPGSLAAFTQWQRDQVAWNHLRTDYTSRLSEIHCPALVIHGERDSGVPVARARRAAELIPDSELLVIPGAGHWVQRDAPDQTVASMTRFLDRLDW